MGRRLCRTLTVSLDFCYFEHRLSTVYSHPHEKINHCLTAINQCLTNIFKIRFVLVTLVKYQFTQIFTLVVFYLYLTDTILYILETNIISKIG